MTQEQTERLISDLGLIPEIHKIGGSKDAVLYLDPPAR